MNIKNDYRFCVQSSLQILKEQREKICNDTLEYDPVIYNGLHTDSPELQKLYFQYYIILWLDSHWDNMQNVYNNHNEYTIDQRKKMTLFFAKYFCNLVKGIRVSGELSALSVPAMLKTETKILEDIMIMNEKWDKKSNELRVHMKKNQESFKRTIKQFEMMRSNEK